MADRLPITHDTPGARFVRELYPNMSYCGRCGYPWNRVVQHATRYNAVKRPDGNVEVSGAFPLCEGCWTLLETVEARMPYYVTLYEWWDRADRGLTADEKLDLYLAVKLESELA